MEDEALKPWQKPELLENSVMRDNPNELAKVFKNLGDVEFTAQALGLACRYRGLETVKTLVEGGATFACDMERLKQLYRRSDRDVGVTYENKNFSLALADSVNTNYMMVFFSVSVVYKQQILPLNERLRILEYLIKNADKTGFKPDEFLFYIYFSKEREMISYLKDKGYHISENKAKLVAEGGKNDEWFEYCFLVEKLESEVFFRVMNALVDECGGKKLHITEWFLQGALFDFKSKNDGFWEFLLRNFDFSKMNKGKVMKEIIDADKAEALKIAAEYGWIRQPKKRDEMINYAVDNNKTECTAFLLDFKNRTADLAAERARQEKKTERELNAAPNSVTALKPLWNYKKNDNGTLTITGYKGTQTEVTVPERIGKNIVTAIGESTFSCDAPRIRDEQRKVRASITKIVIPETVTSIGSYAFSRCRSLSDINIPENVESIREYAFYNCSALSEIKLPSKLSEISVGMLNSTAVENIVVEGNIKRIGALAFYNCQKLKKAVILDGVSFIDGGAFYGCWNLETIEIPKSVKNIYDNTSFNGTFWLCTKLVALVKKDSYAEEYCERNNISHLCR